MGALTGLTADAVAALAALPAERLSVTRERIVVSEGERPRRLHVLVDGWAARMKLLPDGRRHLSALLVPGDLCDVDGLHVRAHDYGVVALTPCVVACIDRAALLALTGAEPAVAQALTWAAFVDNAMLSEAAASLARRGAGQRLAHLLCELHRRLQRDGAARPDGYLLPLSQEQIGDALGLTGVHVNRTLRELREAGLATVAARRVIVRDWDALEREAAFSPAYLHLDGMRRDG